MKPILFNTDMVRGILDGRKTVTRRVVKPQPEGRPVPMTKDSCWPGYFAIQGTSKVVRLPYQPGDILWVRETWTKEGGEYFYRADFDSDFLDPCETLSGGYPHECTYHPGCEGCMRGPQRIYWRPSIHMPREAARIFLRVTGVRVERLQEITEQGAEDEGCRKWCEGSALEVPARSFFCNLWDSTIKPAYRPTYGWEANPWVWVIEFERISREEADHEQ